MAQLSWSRISPDRIREKSFTKIFRSYIFTCKQKSVQDMLYCEHNHSPFKCFLFMLRERGGCDFNFGETRFHFLMSLMKKIFAILISWKHSRNNPGCLTKRSYLRKGQECCGNRTGVCFFRYRKDGKERSVTAQGECILEKNARKSMEGGEKKRVSHMRMNPCRRNAGEVRVRRKRVGRVERESLDFLQKMCRFPLQ